MRTERIPNSVSALGGPEPDLAAPLLVGAGLLLRIGRGLVGHTNGHLLVPLHKTRVAAAAHQRFVDGERGHDAETEALVNEAVEFPGLVFRVRARFRLDVRTNTSVEAIDRAAKSVRVPEHDRLSFGN